MNNSESGFDAFSNTEQPIDTEQIKQSPHEEIRKFGSVALSGYETEADHENLAHKLFEKAKGSRAFKAVVAAGLAATMAFSLAACSTNKDINQASDQSASEFVGQTESTALSGEQSNGIVYDYSHYADIKSKESANAYDYDMSHCFGDEAGFTTEFMQVAKRTPEALASYAYMIFTDEEKQELGIGSQMSMVEIDDAMSNGENGGALRERLLNKLQGVLQDKDTTRFTFYKENDYEISSYTYFVDENNNGVMNPVKMHLGQAYVKRSGAEQVDIERKIATANGGTIWAKKADINLRCGGQVNGRPEDFKGVPVIDPNNPTPTPEKPTSPSAPQPTPPPTEVSTNPPTEPTEWGKQGDPHGGPDVIYSEEVDPDSEVPEEYIEDTNKGDQGYKDDKKAIPGSGSENDNPDGPSSNSVTAPDAEKGERLPGGDKQDDSQTNGNNPYRDDDKTEEGQKKDDEGDSNQKQAQKEAEPGKDNHSDADEENPNNW